MNLWERIKSTKDLWTGNVQAIADKLDRAQVKAGDITPRSVPPDQTTAPYDPTRRSLAALSYSFGLHTDRFNLVKDCHEMYLNDGRVRASLDGIGELSTMSDNNGRPFEIAMHEDPAEQKRRDGPAGNGTATSSALVTKRQLIHAELDRFVDREGIELRARASTDATMTLLEGSRFQHIIVDFKRGEVVERRDVPGPQEGYLMKRFEDTTTGQFIGYGLFDWTTLSLVKVYNPWEILHFCWNPVGSYGLPLPSSSRLQWKRQRETEADLYVSRHARSGLKLVHSFPGEGENRLKDAQDAYELRQTSNPPGPLSDIFTGGAVSAIDPKNNQLVNIDDVKYNAEAVAAGLRHNRGLMGLGDTQNRAVLEMQFQAEIPLLENVTTMLARQYRKIIRIQMILQGRDPVLYGFGLEWAEKDPTAWAARMEQWTSSRQGRLISATTYHEKIGQNAAREAGRMNDEAAEAMGFEEADQIRGLSERTFSLEAEMDDIKRNGNGTGESLEALVGARRQ